MLTREQLLAPAKWPTETVKLPDRGGEILIRSLSAGELMSFQEAVQSKKNGGAPTIDERTVGAKLLVRCIVDKTGGRTLHDDDWEIIHQEWSARDFQIATTAAMRLSGYGGTEGNV